LSGRLELEFGDIDCEFGGSARLLPRLLNSVTMFLITYGLVEFMLIFSHQQSKVEISEMVFNTSLKFYLY